uniref:MOB kinase activator 1A n=1 Tax=Monopterus albus TaxID=43700 RepID=A0A3Q3IN09_MONAL
MDNPALIQLLGNHSSKTFKPKKNIPESSHQYELLKHTEATVGSGNLQMAVMLPEGEDLNEWVTVNSKSQVYLLHQCTIFGLNSDKGGANVN